MNGFYNFKLMVQDQQFEAVKYAYGCWCAEHYENQRIWKAYQLIQELEPMIESEVTH